MMDRIHSYNIRTRYFFLFLSAICVFYLTLELFLNHYTMLSADEFWFAHAAYQFKHFIPYLDFAPYKTVFGYYLLLIPLSIAQGDLTPLIFTKNLIALLNTSIFFTTAGWLQRYVSRQSILMSLFFLIISEFVISYSTNLRVDLFAYWVGFFSLLLLLEKRYLSAGIFIGLAFTISQKAIWYFFASTVSLSMYWAFQRRQPISLFNLFSFGIAAFSVVIFYLIVWSLVANWHTVLASVFYEASVLYHFDGYVQARSLFWSFILIYNPLLFLLAPLLLLSLLISYPEDQQYGKRFIVVIYTLTILLCLIPYKQIFPYYMQVLIPIFLIAYAFFFHWLFAVFKSAELKFIVFNQRSLFLFLMGYGFFIFLIKIKFHLAYPYFLIDILPVVIGVKLFYKAHPALISFLSKSSMISLIMIGALYPLSLIATKLITTTGEYQKATVRVLQSLLKEGGDYIAGVDLIYHSSQPIAGMKHLMAPAIEYLYSPSKTLRPMMLAALNEDPNVTVDSIISSLKQSNVKLYVNNYRMHYLPRPLKDYLSTQYEHFWGSIYLYAPLVSPSQHQIELKFSGLYFIETAKPDIIQLNGRNYKTNHHYQLNKGVYISSANEAYRLKLIPTIDPKLLTHRFQKDDWYHVI